MKRKEYLIPGLTALAVSLVVCLGVVSGHMTSVQTSAQTEASIYPGAQQPAIAELYAISEGA